MSCAPIVSASRSNGGKSALAVADRLGEIHPAWNISASGPDALDLHRPASSTARPCWEGLP